MITTHLAAAYDEYCKRHGLPEMSAEELLLVVEGDAEWSEHECFLRAFILVWDDAQKTDDEHAKEQL